MKAVRTALAAALLLTALAASPPPRAAAPRVPVAARGIATPPPASAGGIETPFYRIVTDEIQGNDASGDFTIPGTVHFYRPGTDGVADRARGNSKRGIAVLAGHVVVHDTGSPELSQTNQQGPATLSCDQLQIDSRAETYTATGDVHFEQGGAHGTARAGRLDRRAHLLTLEGDVSLAQADGTAINTQNIEYNLDTKAYRTVGAPITIREPVPAPTPAPPGATPTPRPKKRPL